MRVEANPSILRVTWAPHADTAAPTDWWHPSESIVCDALRLGRNVAVSRRDGLVEASWHDTGWQPAGESCHLVIRASRRQLRISVPAIWRARAYLHWRDGTLLISSDLTTLASAVPETRPSLEGIALFLAGDAADVGVAPSLYRGIWQLQPGHSLTVQPDGRWQWERTWTPERADGFASQPLELVSRRLQNDLDSLAEGILCGRDRVGCLFSGGLDSSLVAATLLRRAPERVALFNVGSALGTPAEDALRASFLRDFKATSFSVDLPGQASLVQSLRTTNAVAPLPQGSPFSHVFEEIIRAARAQGCDAIATGDGGDEIFAEREEVLVDLLARRSPALASAAAFFALRNGERATSTLRRAARRLRALNTGAPIKRPPAPAHRLWGPELAGHVELVQEASAHRAGDQWRAGWTYSGIESHRRATLVPQWEPISTHFPDFPVFSPLADPSILYTALALRRDELVPEFYWGQLKWLLRHAALHWLKPEIALHPKIGSSDGQILARVRAEEHDDLLNLLSSDTARRIGLDVPAAARRPDSPLWNSDEWIPAAALAAWFDRALVPPAAPIVVATPTIQPARPRPPVDLASTWRPAPPAASWRVVVLAALNLAAQLAPLRASRHKPRASSAAEHSSSTSPTARTLIDLARRACVIPGVTGAPRVMCRSLAWYLRLTGQRPVTIRGTAEGTRETLHWIEIDGSVVDVSAAETPLRAEASESQPRSRTPDINRGNSIDDSAADAGIPSPTSSGSAR